VGESLLPACMEILDLLDASEVVAEAGFQRKPGAYMDWKGEQWSLDFGELSGNFCSSYQVPRAEFDHILLKHSQNQGALVHQGVSVRELLFEGDRPVSAVCAFASAEAGTAEAEMRIDFDYLIDASGRSGLMSTRYLKNRRFHQSFQNVAIWGYWSGAMRPEAVSEGAIAVSSIPQGWLWYIPFSDGRTSLGVVIHKDRFQALRKTKSMPEIYADVLQESSLFQEIVARGELTSELRVEQDYSYQADRFAGPGYFLAGDSACFLDPLLSTGVHLAMYSSMLAAAGIASLIRGEVTETETAGWYDESYRGAFLRFMVFISAFYETQSRGKLGFYKQAEEISLFDADPTNLRRAFLNTVSGMEDIASAEQTTAHLMGEMSRRIRENLDLRADKSVLREAREKDLTKSSAKFFDSIEGLSCLSECGAVEGFYVRVRPRLGLARTVSRQPVFAEPQLAMA